MEENMKKYIPSNLRSVNVLFFFNKTPIALAPPTPKFFLKHKTMKYLCIE